MLLYRLRLRKQRLPTGQDLFGPLDNAEPQLPGHVPAGAEVQQRLLPDPAVDTDVAHQAVGLAGLSGLVGVGLGRLDEHCRLRFRPLGRIAERGGGARDRQIHMALQDGICETVHIFQYFCNIGELRSGQRRRRYHFESRMHV